MPWTKLSDDFSDDCWKLSDAAFRLHVEGLVWSNRKLLDGRIPVEDVRRFAKRPEALSELLEHEWWVQEGEDCLIRHHSIYLRPAEAVLNQQAVNAENGKKGGRPPGPPRERAPRGRKDRKTESVTESVSEWVSEPSTERDRTGQDRSGREELPGASVVLNPVAPTNPWADLPVAIPGGGGATRPGAGSNPLAGVDDPSWEWAATETMDEGKATAGGK